MRMSRDSRCARSPTPVSVTACASWPAARRRGSTRDQHHAPCQAPWTSTNCGTRLTALLPAIAFRIAAIEDHAPYAGCLEPPDRLEVRHVLAGGIAHRSEADRERTRVEHLDLRGLPRERRLGLLVEALPEFDDRRLAAQRGRAREEHRLVRD